MSNTLLKLAAPDLTALAAALRSGRLGSPYPVVSVQRCVGALKSEPISTDLRELATKGFTEQQIALVCELLVKRTPPESCLDQFIDLVTTGPDTPVVDNRDTSVVVREMFTKARTSVLLAGYTVYNGHRVFQALASRMNEVQGLRVQCMLDIQRPFGDQTLADVLVKRFVANFKAQNWPEGARLPEIYYDPRSLELLPDRRASLHAKCVVVDGSEAFVSSANFTEAAQEKNIEAGVLLKSPAIASKLTTYFEALIDAGLLRRVC